MGELATIILIGMGAGWTLYFVFRGIHALERIAEALEKK